MVRRFAALVFTAICLAGCGQDADPAAGSAGVAAPGPAAGAAGEASVSQTAQPAMDDGSVPDGRAVYEQFCASCHDTGVEDAPVTGNPADWENRSVLWQAVLMEHAKAGYLEMPARGGESLLSDLAVSEAVEYMLLVTYPQKLPD